MVKSLLKRLALTALFATSVASYCAAADVSSYTWDFSKEIDVSKPDFKVGPNWGHIAGFVNDYDGTKHTSMKKNPVSMVELVYLPADRMQNIMRMNIAGLLLTPLSMTI